MAGKKLVGLISSAQLMEIILEEIKEKTEEVAATKRVKFRDQLLED